MGRLQWIIILLHDKFYSHCYLPNLAFMSHRDVKKAGLPVPGLFVPRPFCPTAFLSTGLLVLDSTDKRRFVMRCGNIIRVTVETFGVNRISLLSKKNAKSVIAR